MTEIIRHRKHKIMHGAVEHNGVLYFGGHAANDLSQGMADQTREVCAKLDTFLAELGSDKTKILAARIYLSDMSQKEEMNKAGSNGFPRMTFRRGPRLALQVSAIPIA
jgi:enamine deaminase RidA (YjgF/YER057c/UK114 family)